MCVQTLREFECCRGFHDQKAAVSCLRGFSSDVMQLFRVRRNDQTLRSEVASDAALVSGLRCALVS